MSLIPSELRDEQLRASNLMIEESAHHRNQCNDPGSKRVLYMSDQDMLAMRAKFPFLREFSDNFIRSTPPESLLKMEATTIKMQESERYSRVRTTGGLFSTKVVFCQVLAVQLPNSG
jgi:hypothetical protein